MCFGGVLHVYKGEYGLPSIDFECLRTLCLVKFVRCPIQIETNSNPLRSGAGVLPYLQIGKQKFIGYNKIKDFLDKEKYSIDQNLSKKFTHHSTAYSQWVFNSLHAYYHYFMYGEPNNIDTTRTLYAKRTPFPFSFYYPGKYNKEAIDIVQIMGGFDIRDKVEKHQKDVLIENAKVCVNMLSKKLNQRIWFFGDIFSELDAIVYSYLSILFKISLPENPLQNHIKACQNLVNFINRITKDIFQKEAFNSIKMTKTLPSDPMLTATELSFLESEKKTKIYAGLAAVFAMTAFGVWRGFARQLRSQGTLGYEDEDDDDDNEDLD